MRKWCLVVLVCVAALCADAAAEPWLDLAPLNQARQEVAVAELDGKIYVIGGFAGLAIVDTVEVYDPVQQSWSNAAPLPTVIHHTAAVGLDGTLYVIGGWTDFFNTPTAAVWAYDPGSDMWSERAPRTSPSTTLSRTNGRRSRTCRLGATTWPPPPTAVASTRLPDAATWGPAWET
jgi:N-acetylneuraminic acid mutarotase